MKPESKVVVAQIVLGLQIGGLERVVVNLVRGLDAARFRPVVVCLEEGGPFVADIESAGIPVLILGKRPGRDWEAVRRLAQFFKQESVQIVHTHNPTPHFHGIAAAMLAGVPIRVHTKHGRNYPDDKRKVFINHVLSWFTDVIVPVSDDAGAVSLLIEKVNPNKVKRIWNGVDIELYKPVGSQESRVQCQPPQALAINPRSLTIGTVARLSSEKDQTTMLAAFRLVVNQIPEARLVFVGDGPCMAELQNETKRLNLERRVDFLGARNDVPALLHCMDVFTLSSITEGISMTILEAMACGVPIVASDVGGNREIVQPPQCGLIVPVRDPQALATAYLELLRDPVQREQMSQTARKRVSEYFDLIVMVKEYHHLYEELLQAKSLAT